jgi:hypothetical protein
MSISKVTKLGRSFSQLKLTNALYWKIFCLTISKHYLYSRADYLFLPFLISKNDLSEEKNTKMGKTLHCIESLINDTREGGKENQNFRDVIKKTTSLYW